MTVTIARYQK